ncbi:frequency clock protein [Dactylonectria macrodidyma]|uniref:Frequency clock protein n=1 Tax=Dactylonectria macrodidyma TaxID=307937 RepID=A0A9P9JE84_9HYPO|nr:frequency clock protein [Dactylonectria macrodidyma]
MASTDKTLHETKPTPASHPLPRRASPSNSVTLRHHTPHNASLTTKPALSRRISSNESHETGQSDPKHWFDQSNENPTATFGNSAMDIDPPFFQKESDSSNEDKPFAYDAHLPVPKTAVPQSSSADDYRSVIDDLTVEIQRLKEELKWYKQSGPDMLRNEKLFEIKVHGLPNTKKRELEATLRDFAAGLGSSPSGSNSHRNRKSSRHTTRDHMYSTSGSMSKHASSSSGSHMRPTDSAYASMSTGDKSGTSLARPLMMQSKDANEKKVESYLRDIPEGLYPRHMIMSDRERKKLVVRRLEQLFTGKITGRHAQKKQNGPEEDKVGLTPVAIKAQPQKSATPHQPSGITPEAAREAKILPSEQQSGHSGKKSRSRDISSTSNSHGDHTESGGNGTSSRANPSPPLAPPAPEQRPTRPRDLDPDRTQIPSENMDYIRHLGLVPPELLAERSMEPDSVHPDADGWVYLNLLCSLAQLHIINVTPEFVRVAVSEYSSKFQLSSDGRKIRWRGGSQGTKFSSDSSGYNSQQSPSTCDTDDSDKKTRKRQKVVRSAGDDSRGGSLGKKASKSMFGAQDSGSFESFHYKPILIHRESSTSMEGTLSSPGVPEESNVDDSRWGMSGSCTSNRRKRRHDGAIIYYSGAPFCTDLSGDPGDISPPSNMLTASQSTNDPRQPPLFNSPSRRTYSGSCINDKPLSDRGPFWQASSELSIENVASLDFDDSEELSDVELELVWSAEEQRTKPQLLEPCGLGGVLPDDHFMVVVKTKRPKEDAALVNISHQEQDADEIPDGIIRRLASMSTSSQAIHVAKMSPHHKVRPVGIEYSSGSIKRLKPVSLPPPAMFFPPFSTDDSSADDTTASDSSIDLESSRGLMSQVANPHNDYPDGVDLSSGDEDGEDPDDSPGEHNMYDLKVDGKAQGLPNRNRPNPQ